MKDYLANEVRNVVVLGHSGAGKSSVKKRTTEDEMAGWHHQLNRHEFE